MRITREELYITVAETFAKRSTCGRLQVGCVLVRDGRIISTGYNGPLPPSTFIPSVGGKAIPIRMKNTMCSCDLEKPCQKSIHAEANAISFSAKNGISLENSTLYVTHSPCIKCAELIIQAGIIGVIYKNDFRVNDGLLLLENNNIRTTKYEQI